ncbi:hypothetical protein [Schlesneria paludicola]|uniref:hypothetical protein n=1 Tax=Schlesneria paludicola TaxID=360056 RepID=UPI00029AD00C|nr:hypothetical protein [Schlesneria paludicola]
MPLPPIPTTPDLLVAAAPGGVPGQSVTNPAVLLGKLKLLQESVNELQQQLSELVDEVTKANSPSKP